MTWPPPRPEEQSIESRPWDPRHPDEPSLHKESDRLVYVVVDECLDSWVGLSSGPWPHADPKGRLRFGGQSSPIEVGTSRKALQDFLARRRATANSTLGVESVEDEASDSAGERVRVGMTFAARVRGASTAPLLERLSEHAARGEVRIDDLGTILTRPVDLTDKGRLLARLACFSAVSSTVPLDVENKWLDKEIEA